MAIYECEFHYSDLIDQLYKSPWLYLDNMTKLTGCLHFGLKSQLKKSPILERNGRIYLDTDHLKLVYWNGDANGSHRYVTLVGFPYFCVRTFHLEGMDMFNKIYETIEFVEAPIDLVQLGRQMIDDRSKDSLRKKLDRILDLLEEKLS